jgi:hypothetical protein
MEKNKEEYFDETINEMKALGTYKKEYERIIGIYAGMLFQYDVLEEKFVSGGFEVEVEFTNTVKATNTKKSTIYQVLEILRKDIAAYSNILLLNPKALSGATVESKGISKLESYLRD